MFKNKLHNRVYALIAIGILMIALIFILSDAVNTNFNKTSYLWGKNIQQEVMISKSIALLNSNMGYGGFIHNFKNLIIRRDLSRYQHALERNIVELTSQLDKIELLATSNKDRAAIKTLRLTFNEYVEKYEIAKNMILNKKTTSEIDSVVKVSDKKALVAMNTLSSSINMRAEKINLLLINNKFDAQQMIQIVRLLIFIFIIVVISFLIRYVKREFEINIQLLSEKEKAEHASMVKSQFLSSMSHELRTPMNAILGFSHLLEMKADDEVMKHYIHEIISAGNNLLELINQVLDLSKIQTGMMVLSINRYNLSDLLNESLLIIQPMIDKYSIEIDNKIDSSPAYTINVDKARFRQILINLLSNAIKYNHENGKVIIDCMQTDENMLCLSVSDTGKGLTAEQQSHLFKPFDRAGAENSNIAGAGLGLVISKDLIEKMNGTIGFESESGKGSRFWIQLPLS